MKELSSKFHLYKQLYLKKTFGKVDLVTCLSLLIWEPSPGLPHYTHTTLEEIEKKKNSGRVRERNLKDWIQKFTFKHRMYNSVNKSRDRSRSKLA